ncbi:endonuclease MutS2 [Sporosarcina sp. G11-34]|uniref:endonuclease MutS2 n=1 Tax=Sporosarcina sp. G11-34 TaxID=2849605 RepID=UPI0022A8E8D6|nr:endonuclease MutS2 [Sporosarcina sp. G11-34]MCZ2258046.1 endonuclease MutS2 [Sporosarcina sp. G11-34]
METRVLKTLEFDKIRELVAAHCTSSVGRSHMEKLVPVSDFAEVLRLLEETDEGLAILRVRGNVPMGGIKDIRPHAKRAQMGGLLSAYELMETSNTIRASRILRHFIEGVVVDEDIKIPHFIVKKDAIPVLTGLEHEINSAIDDNGHVVDSASGALRSIRSGLRMQEARVRERLESYTRGPNAAKMLSDTIVTIRNDRFVIPVKSEYRSHYAGVIHDMSSSGQTVFIEPDAVVQANNEIRNLKLKEQEEIDKILLELSAKVQEVAHDLFVLIDILSEIDVVLAKAKYGTVNKYTKPEVNNNGYIRLSQAWHPLLPVEEAVANNIEFGKDITTIVITGPNTGGKTVTLKTVGLSVLMAQAGLPIPALDGSEIAVFDSVYADIGDEQSIEQSLSTFSSRMVNIIDILKKYDDQSLIILDELGSGTDPQEGAALAISILDEVHGRGARVLATTHYPELKAYGYNRPGIANASVEFDIDTLSPTYRLLIGVPGRSNAFEISKRLGLSDRIIDRAKTFTGTDRGEVESMIASLEDSRVQSEKDAEKTHAVLLETERLKRELEERLTEFEKTESALKEKAKERARKIVEDAKRESEAVISDLRALQLNAGTNVKEHELIEARKRLENAAPDREKKKAIQAKEGPRPLAVGDEVKVLSYGQKGTLLDKVSAKEWIVQIGILKMKLDESGLQYIKPEKEKQTYISTSVRGRDSHVKLELDLRGERYEDALIRTEKYLDDAILSNYHQVSIIHGKGTGVLRQAVQKYLKNHSRVKTYRFGESSEGGHGVTVVELK